MAAVPTTAVTDGGEFGDGPSQKGAGWRGIVPQSGETAVWAVDVCCRTFFKLQAPLTNATGAKRKKVHKSGLNNYYSCPVLGHVKPLLDDDRRANNT